MPFRSRLIELTSEGEPVLADQDQDHLGSDVRRIGRYEKRKSATQIFEGQHALTVDQSLDELLALCSDVE
jgi:hypothetical protein